MSFVQKNLSANETIVYQTKLHWWVFVPGGVFLIAGILLISQSAGLGSSLIFIALIMLLAAYLNKQSSEFVVTTKRVILKTGLISRKLVEIQLNKADGLIVEQGLIGRILNFGGVRVTSAGVTNAFAPMDEPFVFKKHINEAVETYTVYR